MFIGETGGENTSPTENYPERSVAVVGQAVLDGDDGGDVKILLPMSEELARQPIAVERQQHKLDRPICYILQIIP